MEVTGQEARFRAMFAEEAEGRLATLSELLLELERNGEDQELLSSVFREAHTLKGAAAVVGLADVLRVAHAMEEVLERLRRGDPATPTAVDAKARPPKPSSKFWNSFRAWLCSAPSATTSSGWSMMVGAIRRVRCKSVAASGIRLDPPTRNTPASVPSRTTPLMTVLVSETVRSRTGRASRSSCSRPSGTSSSINGR